MPLSKARDRERKRQSRLENKAVQPKLVQPNKARIEELRQLIDDTEAAMYDEELDEHGDHIDDYVGVELDADGNPIPSLP